MTDREFLIWIYRRIADPAPFRAAFIARAIIANHRPPPANKTTASDEPCGNNLKDLTRRLEGDAPETSAMDRSDLTSFGMPRTPPPWKLPD